VNRRTIGAGSAIAWPCASHGDYMQADKSEVDKKPANEHSFVAFVLKLAGLNVLYLLLTFALLVFAIWLIKTIWNIV
jgi:hypothetical protein